MEFRKLEPFTIELAEKYKECFNQSKTSIADACPNSRFAWNLGYHYRYFIVDNCICLISDGGIFTKPHFSLPIGELTVEKLNKILKIISEIFEHEKWQMLGLFIDEEYVDLFNQVEGYKLTWSYDEDFSDYLYETKKLYKLKGKDYRVKRNHVNKFIRGFPDFNYRSLEKGDREKAVSLVRTWCQDKEVDCSNPIESDCGPIDTLFSYWDELDIHGGVIYLEDDLIAFSMGSIIHDGEMAVMHFEKAHPDYEGLYSVINQLTTIYELEDTKYINREEDMGDMGLRLAKESYFPVKKIKKYRLKLDKNG